MIKVHDDRIEAEKDGVVSVLRFGEIRTGGVLIRDLPEAERQAYIQRSVEKLKALGYVE